MHLSPYQCHFNKVIIFETSKEDDKVLSWLLKENEFERFIHLSTCLGEIYHI